jgi:hypothetical protein
MRHVLAKIFLWGLACTLVVFTLANPVLAATQDVNCTDNQTITAALAQAVPGDTIRISGTCHEVVVITTDQLTLEGLVNAVIDGEGVDLGSSFALLSIDGAQGVVLTGQLTVQNSAGNRPSAGIGMGVVNNAQAFFRGNIVIQGSASHGLLIFSGGTANFQAGTVDVIDNSGDGIVVGNGANAEAELAPADAFTITSDRNTRGFHMVNGGSFEMLGGTLNAADNRVHGLRVAYGSNLFITGLGKVFLQRNPQGLSIESNAQALVSKSPSITEPTVTITDNTTAGVSVQAGFIDLSGAIITDNGSMDAGLDIDLGFGTRAHLTGNTIGILDCDETVLLSPTSDVACPAPPAQ